ncbi:MAG: cysteine--tRNA ligase, partial [Candidatus Methylumidiphilus sp.]
MSSNHSPQGQCCQTDQNGEPTPMTKTLNFFNTRSRRIEPFVPITPGEVGLYCCGPTVYNYAHIGNLRTYFFEDTLRRALEGAGYAVRHVMNITDVGHLQSDEDLGEDKMAIASRREGRSPWEIAKHYEAEFFRHTDLMNIQRPTVVCRATGHIADMIAMIQRLIEQGHAYESGGNVYYEVATFGQYGEFAQLQLANRQASERVELDPRKRAQFDFALWFSESKYPNQIMKWDSPWGEGFPGWHIECSAMASLYLGEHFDLHCGGIDHVPVHHTNEIAQAEGCFGHRWVNYWMHGEFLTLDADKMSKSSGNFLHLDRLAELGFEPLDYRYLLLTTHYRTQLQLSDDGLAGARAALKTLNNLIHDWRHADAQPGALPVREEVVNAHEDAFWEAIADDLHTPKALAIGWSVA